MKNNKTRIITSTLCLLLIVACKKNEVGGYSEESSYDSSFVINDSISSVATINVENKQFIKTAQVNMEVQDVYRSTINIETSAIQLNGFVVDSNLLSNVISENNYSLTDTDAIIVKKYQSENTLKVRIPTNRLGEFLEITNQNSVFLNNRKISAEDITANIQYAELESARVQKNAQNIKSIQKNDKTIAQENDNLSEENQQKLNKIITADQLKYSTVEIHLKESGVKMVEIPVTNTKNFDHQYKYNFWFDIKNAIVEGFYLVQRILITLVSIWPLLIVFGLISYLWRKRKQVAKQKVENSENITP